MDRMLMILRGHTQQMIDFPVMQTPLSSSLKLGSHGFLWKLPMAEFYGTDMQVAIQKRMRERQVWIEKTPEIANGGRVLNFLDPEKTGWERVRELFAEDHVITVAAHPLATMMPLLRETFGEDCQYPYWNVFAGHATPVLAACKPIIGDVSVPEGWLLESLETPTDAQVSEVQELNLATGIAPYPAFYSRV